MTTTVGKRKISVWIILCALALLAGVYLLFDPAETVWMPKCPVHVLTGFDCPGCGSQRAFHALLNGDFEGMVRANALLVIFFPFILLTGVAELNKKRWPRLYRAISQPAVIYSLLGLVIAWTILRNIFFPL